MLAALQRELPIGGYLYEPKWDGLRCLAFVEAGDVDLRSRHGRPLGRYFPELTSALAGLGRDAVIDGEIVIAGERGFDFAALLNRTHPAASRVARLSRETPATLIAFDLVAVDGAELGGFAERRRALLALVAHAGPRVRATEATDDPRVAQRWLDQVGGGVDGVVAKPLDLRYQPGKRAMIKIKRARTADCVLAGFRVLRDQPTVSSLLLGLWDGDELRHVGCARSSRASGGARCSASCSRSRRASPAIPGSTASRSAAARSAACPARRGAGIRRRWWRTGSRSAPSASSRSRSITSTVSGFATRRTSCAGVRIASPRRAASISCPRR